MSYFNYIAFPKKLKMFRFCDIKGREKDYGINYDTTNFRKDILLSPLLSPDESNIIICDKKEATFDNCFKNLFIYEYHVYIPHIYHNVGTNIIKADLDEETKSKELKKLENNEWLLYQQVQYNFIIQNLSIGEFVEIYTEFVHNTNFSLGSPELKYEMDLNEFLNIPTPKGVIDKNKRKITIHFKNR